jgi:hypothetical protein
MCSFSGIWFPLSSFLQARFPLEKKEANALRGGPRRFAARAVKAAGFAFIEAK